MGLLIVHRCFWWVGVLIGVVGVRGIVTEIPRMDILKKGFRCRAGVFVLWPSPYRVSLSIDLSTYL